MTDLDDALRQITTEADLRQGLDEDRATRDAEAFEAALHSIRNARPDRDRTPAQRARDTEVFEWAMGIAGGRR